MKKLKVGIIGLGFGITSHLPAFKRNKFCNVIALCSKNSKKGQVLKEKNNIRYYFNNWKKMLNEVKPDVVSIAVPPNEQINIIYACLKKSICVFAEKPLAINVFQSCKILELQKKFKVPCVIDFIFPEIPEWIRAKQIIDSKKFGKIKTINIDLNYQSYSNFIKEDTWKNNIKKGGGILHHVICHVFYYIEWFFEPIMSVSAFLYRDKNCKFSGHTDTFILVKFISGAYAIIKASNNSIGVHEHIINFFNDKGTVALENKTKDWVSGFNLYTINKKYLKKKIIMKKRKFAKNLDSRLFFVSQIVDKLINWIILKKKNFTKFSGWS